MTRFCRALVLYVLASSNVQTTSAACVPDAPDKLLPTPMILTHPAVVEAFTKIKQSLSELFIDSSQDGLSFAVVSPNHLGWLNRGRDIFRAHLEQVHASSPRSAFTFNHGSLKTNETASSNIDGDSVFRVVSVSKNIATLSVLVVSNMCRSQSTLFPDLTLHTPVRHILPTFGLLEEDWEDGGKEITLQMLASHTAGLSRESYSTDFNMVLGNGKANAQTIGAAWSATTAQNVLDSTRKTPLMFSPGQRAASWKTRTLVYRSSAVSVITSVTLAKADDEAAVETYYNAVTQSSLSWSQLTAREIFSPLNMTHTFFGAIPDALRPYVGIPGGSNWADLIIGPGYDAAAGMWSSSNDLAKYLHHIWLSPSPLPIITSAQRRHTLKPTSALPDGKQLVGAGFEIDRITVNTSKDLSTPSEKTYISFGKAGDGGGWHAWIDVIPNLGYGLIILTQHSGLKNYTRLIPTVIRDSIHEILVPAFAEALSSESKRRFAGQYSHAKDSGLITDALPGSDLNQTTYARLELSDQILYLREFIVNGTSALEGLDKLDWTETDQPRYWSTAQGVALTPAEGVAETSQFGNGAQVWRMMLPNLEVCDWFDFDGYSDQNGWPLTKLVIVESTGGVKLHYPPYDVVLERTQGSRAES